MVYKHFYKAESLYGDMKKERKVKEKEEANYKFFNLSAIVLFGIFLIIGIVFYVSLNVVKSGDKLDGTSGVVTLSPDGGDRDFNFGIEEIIYSVVFALFMSGFLFWTKSIMAKNPFLGMEIGIIGSVVIGYGFYLQYWGPYTAGFMFATGLVVLAYLGMNYFRYKN